jgi:plasmid stabilization system protein ParE
VARDLERLIEALRRASPQTVESVVGRISEAISLLGAHPLLGRPIEHGLRELVISRGRTGYLAAYRFLPEEELILILSIRHQREAGFFDPDA